MTPQFHQTGEGTYDVTVDGTTIICTVQAEPDGWAVWASETKPRRHQRLVGVKDTRSAAAQAGIAWVEGQGRT